MEQGERMSARFSALIPSPLSRFPISPFPLFPFSPSGDGLHPPRCAQIKIRIVMYFPYKGESDTCLRQLSGDQV